MKVKNTKHKMSKAFKRYLVIGVSIYLFEIIIILIATHLGASPVLAVALSFWLGLIISFVMQKVLTFGDKRTARKILIPQVMAFSILVIFNFGFTVLITKLLVSHLPATATRTIALGITTIWNFYLYKTRIFKQDENIIY